MKLRNTLGRFFVDVDEIGMHIVVVKLRVAVLTRFYYMCGACAMRDDDYSSAIYSRGVVNKSYFSNYIRILYDNIKDISVISSSGIILSMLSFMGITLFTPTSIVGSDVDFYGVLILLDIVICLVGYFLLRSAGKTFEVIAAVVVIVLASQFAGIGIYKLSIGSLQGGSSDTDEPATSSGGFGPPIYVTAPEVETPPGGPSGAVTPDREALEKECGRSANGISSALQQDEFVNRIQECIHGGVDR